MLGHRRYRLAGAQIGMDHGSDHRQPWLDIAPQRFIEHKARYQHDAVIAVECHRHLLLFSRVHRLTLPRSCLRSPSLALPSRRLRCELRVGRVARRTVGSTATPSTSSCRRRKASSLLASWLRDCCAFNTTTPSLVMRWSRRASRRSLICSGSEELTMSKRRCTALDTLLTFCPPGPCARMALNSTWLRSMVAIKRATSQAVVRDWPRAVMQGSWCTV